PAGCKWDNVNWSCAFDSLFSILTDIWTYCPSVWAANFTAISPSLKLFSQNIIQVSRQNMTLEQARDNWRHNVKDPFGHDFPTGARGTNLIDVIQVMLTSSDTIGHAMTSCECGHETSTPLTRIFVQMSENNRKPINTRLQDWQLRDQIQCAQCRQSTVQTRTFDQCPKIFVVHDFNMNSMPGKTLPVIYGHNQTGKMKLRGIIYFYDFHFVSRIITQYNDVWYNDGQVNRGTSRYEGKLDEFT
ncbi:hypothetical protein C8J56DRAFT_744997, partial [Mycena floridula]